MAVVLLLAAISLTDPRIGPAEAVVAPRDGYGFAVGAPMTWMSDMDADRELDAVARTGATWLRVFVDWNRIEPMPGAYDWGYLDHWVNGATERGLKVLAMVSYTPDWARTPGSYFSAPPVEPAVFASFLSTVVKRYGDRISSWEVWNEPNVPIFFGYLDDRAARYTELLKAAYPAIKAVQPHSTVLAAGMSRAFAPDAPPTFVEAMYALGAKGFFDAIAMHPYVYPAGLAVDDHNGWSDVERVRQLMIDNGDGGKKIWMTEIGAPTAAATPGGVSQQEQARQITDVLAKAAHTDYSGPVFIYSIRDIDTADVADDQDNFGALLTSDWQPKAAAEVLTR
ncbi:family 1 glycosylhydrolase [Mycolicibacterium pulveris]|uniref:family 1 glycosylhydrolase n=1 Tax=Mycolicibacterium pulveris TaxID=36813 RepID=UPI003CFA6F80